MKASEILGIATAFLFESATDDKDFYQHYPKLLNLAVAEAFPCENSIRASKGENELSTAPVVESGETEIEYADEICRIALPFALASYFWQDENDNYRAQDYRARFIDALKEAARAVVTDTEDAYSVEG